jgi:hypothetical protein
MRFDGFDWDDGNLDKCRKHGVSVEEIEAVFAGSPIFAPDKAHSGLEQRFVAAGRTLEGRAVFIAFTLRRRDGAILIRPVSARYMHAKEAARYGRQRSH